MKKNYLAPLEEGRLYHVYNQGNNKENIFADDENRRYFIKKLEFYVCPFVTIVCMCLMDNHFHLLIKVKTWEEMQQSLSKYRGLEQFVVRIGMKLMQSRTLAAYVVSEMFRRFFMAYAKAYNKRYDRTGSLFRKNFKRIEITSMDYLRNVILYIHRQPNHHGLKQDFRDYPWSTYKKWFEYEFLKKMSEINLDKVFGDVKTSSTCTRVIVLLRRYSK